MTRILEGVPSWIPEPANGPVLTGGYPLETAKNQKVSFMDTVSMSQSLDLLLDRATGFCIGRLAPLMANTRRGLRGRQKAITCLVK
jgi:hypothetical protein